MFKKIFLLLALALLLVGAITTFSKFNQQQIIIVTFDHAEALEKDSNDLAKVWQDIRQAFDDIDLKKMEKKLKEKTNSLHRKFNNALDSENFEHIMSEIENRLDKLRETLNNAGDSETAQKLKKSLEDLFKQLEKEAPKQNDVKI